MKSRLLLLVLAFWCQTALAGDHRPPPKPPAVEYHGVAIVNRVEPVLGLINLTHGPVPFAGWDTMTRDLRVKPRELTALLVPGMKIKFQLTAKDPMNYEITALEPVK